MGFQAWLSPEHTEFGVHRPVNAGGDAEQTNPMKIQIIVWFRIDMSDHQSTEINVDYPDPTAVLPVYIYWLHCSVDWFVRVNTLEYTGTVH